MDPILTERAGDPDGLHFELTWADAVPNGMAADATRGRLALWLGDALVWGDATARPAGFSWTWVELVEHLAFAWPYLEWEEADPIGLDVDPEALQREAERRWAELSPERVDAEEQLLLGFVEAHDLSRAFGGAWPAPFWLLREGSAMRLASRGVVARRPLAEVLETLRELGERVCARLRPLDDPRAEHAVARWEARGEVDDSTRIAAATCLDVDTLADLRGGESLASVFELPTAGVAGLQGTELLAVARMAGRALPPSELRRVLDFVRALGARETSTLDRLARLARGAIDPSARPFEQGHQAAAWFRAHRSIDESARVDVEAILGDLGVEIHEVKLDARELDAISCWGPRHGPAIVVNRGGEHGRGTGRRATLAHEIGHLLLDREGALPLAEVLGGRVSTSVEARARAFAAELLLPRDVAFEWVTRGGDIRRAVRATSERFGVSLELIAWQARNSDRGLPASDFAYLRRLVRDRHRF
jgi:Zn-dependent peptidase ImmA (M78 family)